MKVERKHTKLISITLILSIIMQILMPIMMPLKSLAAKQESYIQTTLGKLYLKTEAKSLNVGDIVPVEIYIEGTDIFGIVAFIDYDRTIFRDLEESDIEVNASGWNVNAIDTEYLDEAGYYFEMSHKQNIGTSNFTACTINLEVIQATEETTVTANYVVITDTNYNDTSGDEGFGDNISLTIKTQKAIYNVTYDANTTDTTTGMPSNATKEEDADYTIEAGPTRDGYTFVGWNTASDGTGISYAGGDTYSGNADVTLYAQWKTQPILTVNPNGGTWEGNINSQTFRQDEGTTKTINNPSKTPDGNIISFNPNGGEYTGGDIKQGTTFNGWDGATLSGTTYTFGTANETLTANYKGDSIILPSATKTGATLLGWKDSEGTIVGGAGASYEPEYTTPGARIRLIAEWKEEEYTLTIDENGGTYIGNKTLSGTYRGTVTVSTPTGPNGYTVTLDNNDGTQTTSITQTYTFSGWTASAGNISQNTYTFAASNATLTANYSPDSITLPTATRAGYDFNGWYTSATGGIKIESPYKPTSNKTLYAQWTAKQYTVTFNPNGGSVSPQTKTVTYGQTYGDLPTPTKEGYEFKGWYTSATGGTEVTADTTYTNTTDTTLYAHWEGEEYTLTIDPNGGEYNGTTNTSTENGGYKETKTIAEPTAPEGNDLILNHNYVGGTTETETQTYSFIEWEVISGPGTINGNLYEFGTDDGEIKAKYEANGVTIPTATRAGYKFVEWNTENDGTGTGYAAGSTYEVNGNETLTTDVTLYAQWLKISTLTVDPNGGEWEGSLNSQTFEEEEGTTKIINNPTKTPDGYTVTLNHNDATTNSANTISSVIQTTTFDRWTGATLTEKTYTFTSGDETLTAQYIGEDVALPTPTRVGYEFIEWNTEINGTGNGYAGGSECEVNGDITLYAQWEGKEYKLIFDYKDGEGDVADKNIKNGETYGELPEATKEGHTFIGWYDENDNKVESTDIVNTTSDITIYAKYEINKYFVTFKNDDGTEIKTIKVEHGSNATFTGELPTKEGVAEGYEAIFTGWDNEDALKDIKQDVIVTATYQVKTIVYTITYYNLKDADNSENPTEYTIEDNDITLIDLENQGKYIFKGWYTSNKEDAEKITSIDTSKLGNIVLYAQWENDELYLSSEKYKVGENDIDNYEDGDVYLDKIEPDTTVSELISNIDTNGIITVIDENGNILEEDDLVGTKMTIKATRYDEQIILTAIVMGDLNGDGKVTATDLSTLNQTILYKGTLEEPRFKAADLDDNEKLTATDLSTINKTILGTIKLTYNKNQTII